MSGNTHIRFRLGEDRDRQETLDVMRRASGHLHQSHGKPPSDGPESMRAIAFRTHALRTDPDGFWVAEDGDRIAGFGIATVRADAWYLAALHVLPEYQSAGVGRQILRRCLATSAVSGLRFTLSEALNEVSNGLYARFGMVPRQALLTLEGPATAKVRGALACQALDDNPATATMLHAIDRQSVGMARHADHVFWTGLGDVSAFRLTTGAETVGYAYVNADGVVGPAAFNPAADPASVGAALVECARELGARTVRLRVFGPARALIEYLLGAGFRLQPGIGLLLATEPFGNLDRYLVSSDALF